MTDKNPYRSPESNLQPPEGDDYELVDPRRNPAGRGWQWVLGGMAHLARDWPMWVLTVALGILIMLMLLLVPPLGPFAIMFTALVWHGGLLLGCRAQADGKPFRVGYLFAGFREHLPKLVLLSLVSFVLNLAMAIVTFGSIYVALIEAGGDPAAVDPASIPEPGAMLTRTLIAAFLTVPLAMAFWFAPCLIVMHDVGVAEAIRLSFVGCLRNMAPFMVYGVVGIILFLIVLFVPGVLGAAPGGGAISFLVSLVAIVLGGPVFFGSVFVAYRDIFVRRGAAD